MSGRALQVMVNNESVGVPTLSRKAMRHVDGVSGRLVQWYFNNLLPEEALRKVIAKDTGVNAENAFRLLESTVQTQRILM